MLLNLHLLALKLIMAALLGGGSLPHPLSGSKQKSSALQIDPLFVFNLNGLLKTSDWKQPYEK